MPITRKQQVLAKLETTPGGGATFSASDAIQVFDPSIADTVDTLDRVPAGPTLSRDFTPIGRKTREVNFTSDLRGSGAVATAPEWGALITGCGYKKNDNTDDKRILTVTSGTISGAFQLGEQITQASGADVGVVVGIFSSGGVPKHVTDDDTDVLIVVEMEGTLVSTTLTTGSGSGATDSGATVAASTDHHAYMPTSEKLIQLTVASWTGGTPTAGSTATIKNGTDLVGSVQVVSATATTADVVLLWGSVASGYDYDDGTSTAALSAAPVMTRTPSLAMQHNLDGRNRQLLGARGTFSCAGEVGQPMSFAWTFTGDPGADADASPISTSGLGTVRPPRLLGAICAYAEGTNIRTLQTKSISFDNAGTVSPNLDANSTGGATGANITDRDSALTVQVDNTNSTMDWEALRDAGTVVRSAFLLGDTAGNIVSVVLPNCQVTDVSIGDSDGVSVMDVTLRPRRIAESGDDDVFFCQL